MVAALVRLLPGRWRLPSARADSLERQTEGIHVPIYTTAGVQGLRHIVQWSLS